MQRETFDQIWDLVDTAVEKGIGPMVGPVVGHLLVLDPEGAARRAAALPLYDSEHARATDPEIDAAYRDAEIQLKGGESEQGEPERPHWPAEHSEPLPTPHDPPSDRFVLAAPAALIDCD